MPPNKDPNIENELRDLGSHIEYPPIPDLASSIRGRLGAETSGGGGRDRRLPAWTGWVVAAALLLLVAVPALSLAVRGLGAGAGGMAGGAAEGGGAGGGPEMANEPAAPSQEAQPRSAAKAQASKHVEGVGGGGRRNDQPVPDVVGMKVLAACGELSSRDYAGYVVRVVDDAGVRPGRVSAQEPGSGRRGLEGEPVDLTVSRPYPERLLKEGDPADKRGCLDVTR